MSVRVDNKCIDRAKMVCQVCVVAILLIINNAGVTGDVSDEKNVSKMFCWKAQKKTYEDEKQRRDSRRISTEEWDISCNDTHPAVPRALRFIFLILGY